MQLLEKSLKGLKRLKGETKRDRRPITLTELVCLHNALRPQFTDTLDDTMLWAAFTLAFLGFYAVANSRAILRLIPNVIFHGMILLSTQTSWMRTISKL